MKKIVEQHIYDNNGLVKVEYIEVDETPIEDQIKSKEEQLLEIYNEIQRLKEQQ